MGVLCVKTFIPIGGIQMADLKGREEMLSFLVFLVSERRSRACLNV